MDKCVVSTLYNDILAPSILGDCGRGDYDYQIDYYADSDGNLYGYIDEVTCTPNGGSLDSEWDWEYYYQKYQTFEYDDPSSDRQVERGGKDDFSSGEVELGRQVVQGIVTGDTTVILSPELKNALTASSMGVGMVETLSVELTKVLSESTEVLGRLGKALGMAGTVLSTPVVISDLSDGELTKSDLLDAVAFMATTAAVFVSGGTVCLILGTIAAVASAGSFVCADDTEAVYTF